jgi:hypothetical protein
LVVGHNGGLTEHVNRVDDPAVRSLGPRDLLEPVVDGHLLFEADDVLWL